MINNKKHKTVLLDESIESLNIKKNGTYVDCTFGCGGHSLKILQKIGKYGKLYAIDRDPYAIQIAQKIQDPRFHVIHDIFSNIDHYFIKNSSVKKIDGVILDLGCSSTQIMNASRGFSFNLNGPLDMRMNPSQGISAAQWINQSNQHEISYVLKTFGEEKFSKKIAYAIEKTKKKTPILDTKKLSEIIKKIIPYTKKNKHPATRSFQAIRIFINQEIYEIQCVLKKILNILNFQGRIVIISFHSLEDRIVKQFMKKNSTNPILPIEIPIEENKIHILKKKKIKIINRIFPSKTEISHNPRSRSAILRTAECTI
ncbi:16S rRNA (cytosine(1402)-N(4))-methyltransferase RsmH [Buchnera aphidicola]|uniref:16S rRNA (cytosine(1402)-N(4))-methyltransferase RsmH n=1 Tax=Buchnera aphidicola TaxID=9 RepID=UPI0034641537